MTPIPCEFRAGDTVRWSRSLPDYPASQGWVLTYTLVGHASVHSAVATADGDNFSVLIAAADTASWAPASYAVTGYVTKDLERYTVDTLRIRILPDLAAATGGADTRTHARKVLDAINAWMESRAPVAGEVQLGERRVRNYGLAELLSLRDRYAAMVAREEAAERGRLPGAVLVRL